MLWQPDYAATTDCDAASDFDITNFGVLFEVIFLFLLLSYMPILLRLWLIPLHFDGYLLPWIAFPLIFLFSRFLLKLFYFVPVINSYYCSMLSFTWFLPFLNKFILHIMFYIFYMLVRKELNDVLYFFKFKFVLLL